MERVVKVMQRVRYFRWLYSVCHFENCNKEGGGYCTKNPHRKILCLFKLFKSINQINLNNSHFRNGFWRSKWCFLGGSCQCLQNEEGQLESRLPAGILYVVPLACRVFYDRFFEQNMNIKMITHLFQSVDTLQNLRTLRQFGRNRQLW